MAQTVPGALERAFNAFANLKSRAQTLKAAIGAGNVSALALIGFHDELANTWARNLATLDGRADLNALAIAHLIDPPADFQAQFAAVKAAGSDIVAYIETNLPQSGGWLQVVRFSGVPSQQDWRAFSAAQLAGLEILLDALIAAIG